MHGSSDAVVVGVRFFPDWQNTNPEALDEVREGDVIVLVDEGRGSHQER